MARVTPSAVSQQLRAAQRDAGVPLVEQAGRGLRLTDAGRLLAEGGREVAQTLAVVQARWDAFRGQPAGADGLLTRLLVREPFDIAMRHEHPLTAHEQARPADLVEQEWYGVPLGYPFDTVRIAVEEATGRPVNVVQRLRDNRLIEALVADSDRVAVLSRFTTPGERVTLRPVRDIPTARYIFAMARPDRAERLAVRRVLDAFTSVASRAPTHSTVT